MNFIGKTKIQLIEKYGLQENNFNDLDWILIVKTMFFKNLKIRVVFNDEDIVIAQYSL